MKVLVRGYDGNTHGVGARVQVTAGGRTQVAVIEAALVFAAAEEVTAHFVLGGTSRVEVVRVLWSDGATVELGGVAANQTVVLAKP